MWIFSTTNYILRGRSQPCACWVRGYVGFEEWRPIYLFYSAVDSTQTLMHARQALHLWLHSQAYAKFVCFEFGSC
jgi:hypothetical protein